MHTMIKVEGYDFGFDESACFSCEGNCCRGESGYIWVTPYEISQIARFLHIDEDDFRAEHLRKVRYRYSLKEVETEGEYICRYFDTISKRCTIYEVRPSQCRTFPFWDYFKEHIEEVEKECPGIIRY